MSRTVMLIHGAWLTPASWAPFRTRFERRGYTTLAPAWPHEPRSVEELRRAPGRAFGRLSITAIVEHYARLIEALPEAPILVGHSFGGTFTELLLDRGLGVAGVAIAPMPIQGVFPRIRTVLSGLPVLFTWRTWNRVVQMPFKRFATDFAQTLPAEEKRPAYDRYIVGVPGRLYWQAALGRGTGVALGSTVRQPLLIAVGEMDRMIAPGVAWGTYRFQRHARSLTSFKSFAGRSHFLCVEPGWDEVADFVIEWAEEHQRDPGERP